MYLALSSSAPNPTFELKTMNSYPLPYDSKYSSLISDGKAAFAYFDFSSALLTGSISINCQQTNFDTNSATGSGGLFSISAGY